MNERRGENIFFAWRSNEVQRLESHVRPFSYVLSALRETKLILISYGFLSRPSEFEPKTFNPIDTRFNLNWDQNFNLNLLVEDLGLNLEGRYRNP